MKHTQQSVRLAFKQLTAKDQANVLYDFFAEHIYQCDIERDFLIKHIEAKKIRLLPVLNRENKVLYWTAGYVKVGVDGWTNNVSNQAEGPTPKDAIESLLANRLTIRNSRPTKLGKSRGRT